MKNKKIILGIIVFLFAITGICSIQNVVALDDPDYSVTIIGGHAFKLFWTLNEDDCIKMEYLITNGNADLHLYIRNSTGDVIKDFGTIDDYGIRYFNIPYDDTFEIIFKNNALFTSRDLELNIDIVKNITITSPTSMSTFVNGYNYITWTSSGAISYIIIDLYKDGYFLERITSKTYNDGSYSWYIYTDDYVDSSYYQIKISDYYESSIYDYSSYFTIDCETETITITSPTSTSTFSSGYNYITWTNTGDISYVKIELYKSGIFLETIDSYEYNDGSYSWYIYDDEYVDSSYYQIKILDYYDNTIYDYSGSFTIECETESGPTPTPTPIPDPDPVNTVNRIINIILMIAVISVIISAIVIPIVIHKRKKRGSEEVITPIE